MGSNCTCVIPLVVDNLQVYNTESNIRGVWWAVVGCVINSWWVHGIQHTVICSTFCALEWKQPKQPQPTTV